MDVSLLMLIPRGGFKSAPPIDPRGREEVEDEAWLESHRRVVNNKLLDSAIAQCKTGRLDVLLPLAESRELLPQLYNDIWDFQLVHHGTGKASMELDCRVVFEAKPRGSYANVFCAPSKYLLGEVAVQQDNGSNIIYLECALEAETDYVLYDNAQQTRGFAQQHVALGGTFDRLHAGHKKLLSIALECAKQSVIVGVTSDAMLAQKKNSDRIEPFTKRRDMVVDVCDSLTRSGSSNGIKVDVVQIHDAYGPTITMPELTALVCSSETLVGAKMVNLEREKRGFAPLLPIVVMRSNAHVLSSTFIRDKQVKL